MNYDNWKGRISNPVMNTCFTELHMYADSVLYCKPASRATEVRSVTPRDLIKH